MIHLCTLLNDFTLKAPAVVGFQNGERLSLPAGVYYPVAFGVVIDREARQCIASPKSAWKLGQ
jgi:hypothetical protein